MLKFIHELEHQVEILATTKHARHPGALPSDNEQNPKKVIAITLRYGRELVVAPRRKGLQTVRVSTAHRGRP